MAEWVLRPPRAHHPQCLRLATHLAPRLSPQSPINQRPLITRYHRHHLHVLHRPPPAPVPFQVQGHRLDQHRSQDQDQHLQPLARLHRNPCVGRIPRQSFAKKLRLLRSGVRHHCHRPSNAKNRPQCPHPDHQFAEIPPHHSNHKRTLLSHPLPRLARKCPCRRAKRHPPSPYART